jgi:hypothetical protein
LHHAKKRAGEKRAAERRALGGRAAASPHDAPTPQSAVAPPPPAAPRAAPSQPDFIYGARAIAAETGLPVQAVYYWQRRGYFGAAVWRVGHKTLMASRSRLANMGPPQA